MWLRQTSSVSHPGAGYSLIQAAQCKSAFLALIDIFSNVSAQSGTITFCFAGVKPCVSFPLSHWTANHVLASPPAPHRQNQEPSCHQGGEGAESRAVDDEGTSAGTGCRSLSLDGSDPITCLALHSQGSRSCECESQVGLDPGIVKGQLPVCGAISVFAVKGEILKPSSMPGSSWSTPITT